MSRFTGSIPADDLRSVLKAATVVTNECRIFFEDDDLKVRGTDEGGVALVQIELKKDAFQDSNLFEGDVCLDFSEFTNMIGMADSDTEISLELESHNLIIDYLDLQYTLTLINPETLKRDREKPDIELSSEIVLDASAFKRGIIASGLVADHVEFGINEENSTFYMEAKGDVNEVILEKKKQDLVTLSADSASSTYSVNYLDDFCTAIPDETEVGISLGTEFPAEISFELIDGDAEVTYFIAPRLQEDS